MGEPMSTNMMTASQPMLVFTRVTALEQEPRQDSNTPGL